LVDTLRQRDLARRRDRYGTASRGGLDDAVGLVVASLIVECEVLADVMLDP